jgi:hypothetical protein
MQIGRSNLPAPRPAHLIAQRTALQDKLAAALFGAAYHPNNSCKRGPTFATN